MNYVGLTLKWNENDRDGNRPLTVPQDVYRKGCVLNADQGLAAAKKIGFPVMVKASEGGGGKGIRKVDCEGDFNSLFRQVCSCAEKKKQQMAETNSLYVSRENINKRNIYCFCSHWVSCVIIGESLTFKSHDPFL